MRTRTLLLLAVSCGLAILLAGGIQLWRLANQEPPTPSLEVGGTGMAGDAIVTVTKATDAGDAFVVTVTLAGVDDPDGLEGFTLVGVDLAVKPSSVVNPGSCTGFTVAPVECTLTLTGRVTNTGVVVDQAGVESPRHGVDVSTTETWWIVDDRDGLADLLQLNNAARVMIDGRGQHLVGAAARLRDGAS